MDDGVWLISSGAYVLIDDEVLLQINKYIQKDNDAEAGGCLFGYYRGDHIHISNCTSPNRGDARRLHRFDRKDKSHLEFADSLYSSSGHKCTYIGEWHTHPEDYPTPSGLDYSEWDKVTALKGRWKALTIIVGRKSLWVGLGDVGTPIRSPLKKYKL